MDKVIFIGGSHHREVHNLDPHYQYCFPVMPELTPANIRDMLSTPIECPKETYIRHEFRFGKLEPVVVFLHDKIDPHEWSRNLLLDYLK